MSLTQATREAQHALDYGVPREHLSPGAQADYDRLTEPGSGKHVTGYLPSRAPVYGQSEPESPRPASRPRQPETLEEMTRKTMIYAHQTAVSTQVIAWIVGIFAVLTLIGVIVGIVEVVHALNAINQVQTVP
jgi:hypothetical protein